MYQEISPNSGDEAEGAKTYHGIAEDGLHREAVDELGEKRIIEE